MVDYAVDIYQQLNGTDDVRGLRGQRGWWHRLVEEGLVTSSAASTV